MKDVYSEFRNFALKDRGVGSSAMDNYMRHFNDMTQYVIEERSTNFREVDVFSRLIMDRIIFLGTEITDSIANIIIAQLLFLDASNGSGDISLYINSPGGSVHSGLGIYDTMQYIKSSVCTTCVGLAASMGAVLLSGGASGKRAALEHSRVMIHQPVGGMKGQAVEMEITTRHILGLKKDLYNILAKNTGQNYKRIEKDSDRDYWMNAEEAKEYGLIDKVLMK